MIQQRVILIAVLVLLTGCDLNTWNTGYIPATGYRYHGTTPLSKPHGYDKTVQEEVNRRHLMANNAEAWRNAAGAGISAVMPLLQRGTPIAVIPSNRKDTHDQIAANYIQDILLEQDFLVSLIEETRQYIMVRVEPIDGQPERARLKISVLHDTLVIDRKTIDITIPDEYDEDRK